MKNKLNLYRYIAAILFAAVIRTSSFGMSVTELPVVEVGGQKCYCYEVKAKESVYQVANLLGVTRQQIVEANPSAADGLKPKMRLYFPLDKFKQSPENRPATYAAAAGVTTHLVKKGETVYGIAVKYGMTPDKLVELNPQAAEGLNPGMTLHLGEVDYLSVSEEKAAEQPSFYTIDADPSEETTDATAETEASISESSYVSLSSADTARVAVLLPLMLDSDPNSRTARLFAEFAKGMLLAASDKSDAGNTPLKLSIFDTHADADSLQAILEQTSLREADIVIAPDNPQQLGQVAEAIDDSTILLNIFAIKDTTHLSRPNLVQTNIPHTKMYDRAADAFMHKFSKALPVFIARNSGNADKEAFTAVLKERLQESGREYKEIIYDSALSSEDLEGLDPTVIDMVFVPNTGSKNEFARFVRPILDLRKAADIANGNVAIFGYPEWVTFRGSSLKELGDLGAIIYSRFLSLESDATSEKLRERYKAEYSTEMFDAVPSQGILGYDVACYAIDAARALAAGEDLPKEFTGIQSTLHLERPNEQSGYENDTLYIITYHPDGTATWEN